MIALTYVVALTIRHSYQAPPAIPPVKLWNLPNLLALLQRCHIPEH